MDHFCWWYFQMKSVNEDFCVPTLDFILDVALAIHWNGNVVLLMKLSSLAALEVVILTTSGAASDENFIKMTTFSSQCYSSLVYVIVWRQADIGSLNHDDIIKWRHFLHYWPFVRGIHRSPVNSPHKCLWCGTLIFSLIYAWTNDLINNWDVGAFETSSRSLWHHCNVNQRWPSSLQNMCVQE